MNISLRFTEFIFNKAELSNHFFLLIFMIKLDETVRDQEMFINLSVDPHIFEDPDPGSQNLADPTDPDSKH